MKVCVIGAGPSGLVCIKELLEEGHEVICYEKNHGEGGVFLYAKDKGGVYDSTLLTISNYFMAFSSYPPRKDEGRFQWNRSQYADYLNNFLEHFSLGKHIEFNTNVKLVKPLEQEQFEVTIERNNGLKTEVFDAVAICSGTHQIPKRPTFKGEDTFTGEIIHAESYKNNEAFIDKNVLIVGLGESGADISHEVAQVTKSALLSIRNYPSVTKRYIAGDLNDARTSRILYSFPSAKLNKIVDKSFQNKVKKIRKKKDLSIEDKVELIHAEWSSKNKGRYNQFFTKNDAFFFSIANKNLALNDAGIDRIEKDKVLFNNGESFKADVILCCTGYQDQFNFLDTDNSIEDVRNLYYHCFDPKHKGRLAFIGWARPATGGIPATAELQSRYFALICSNKKNLPEAQEIQKIIEHEKKWEEQFFHVTPHVKTLVFWNKYMDDVAKLIGCKPRILRPNLKLTAKLIYGSQISFQYRLDGPHALPEMAKRIILRLPTGFNYRQMVILSIMALIQKFQKNTDRLV